jgi:hypothetical protein
MTKFYSFTIEHDNDYIVNCSIKYTKGTWDTPPDEDLVLLKVIEKDGEGNETIIPEPNKNSFIFNLVNEFLMSSGTDQFEEDYEDY